MGMSDDDKQDEGSCENGYYPTLTTPDELTKCELCNATKWLNVTQVKSDCAKKSWANYENYIKEAYYDSSPILFWCTLVVLIAVVFLGFFILRNKKLRSKPPYAVYAREMLCLAMFY